MGNSPSLEYWNWPWAPSDEVGRPCLLLQAHSHTPLMHICMHWGAATLPLASASLHRSGFICATNGKASAKLVQPPAALVTLAVKLEFLLYTS